MVQTFVPPCNGPQKIHPDSINHPEKEKNVVIISPRELEESVIKLKAAVQAEDAANFASLLQIIASNVNKETAINVLMFLENENYIAANQKPSAPPESPSDDSKLRQYLCDNVGYLRDACLKVIDDDVHAVLSEDKLPILSYGILYEIMSRDTLKNPREDFLFEYMWRWGYIQCQDVTKIKTILGDLPYLVRYGLMSWASFKRLKDQIRVVLSTEDYKSVKSYLQKRNKCLTVTDLPRKWSKPRLNQTDRSESESLPPPNCFIKCCVGWALLFD